MVKKNLLSTRLVDEVGVLDLVLQSRLLGHLLVKALVLVREDLSLTCCLNG
jgi:hypothetical protein